MTKRNGSSQTPDLVRDYYWLLEQCDDRVELLVEQGADLTAHCMKIDGVWRAPKATFVERELTIDEEDEDADDVLAETRAGYDSDDIDYNDYDDERLESLSADEEPQDVAIETDPIVLTEDLHGAGEANLIPARRSVSITSALGIGFKMDIRADNRYLEQDFRSWKSTTRAPRQYARNKPLHAETAA